MLRSTTFEYQNLSREELLLQLKQYDHSPIRKLKLINCNISDTEIKTVVELLKQSSCSSLEKMDLTSNQLTDEGLACLAEFMSKCPKLKTVFLSKNHLSLADAQSEKSLQEMQRLMEIDLSRNLIAETGAKAIVDKLITSSKLEALDLRHNQISGDLQIAIILKSEGKKIGLASNKPITILQRESCKLIDEDVSRLVRVLSEEKLTGSLEKIMLSGNLITDKGLIALSEVTKRCTKLKVMDLSRNAISFPAMKSVEKAIVDHPAIEKIDLTHNSVVELKEESMSCSSAFFRKKTSPIKLFEVVEDHFHFTAVPG